MEDITQATIISAQERITEYVHLTPILTSNTLDNISGASLFFKCENFQKMGAFKMRGATNAILCLDAERKNKGVVTHSSGNFAQAMALAGKLTNVEAHIVMPENAPGVKKSAVEGYGGRIYISQSNIEAREKMADEISSITGATLLHPSNDLDVILGNSTVAAELLEEIQHLDYIVAPVGGGGLIAGTALASYYSETGCKVIGAEPANVDDAYRSMISGKIEYNVRSDTIADGLRTNLGDVNFPIILKHVDQIILVEEDEIVKAMLLIWERMKIIIEPSSAVAVAAVLKERKIFEGKRVGIIISGGNVDLMNLPF